MALQLETVGSESSAHRHTYDWRSQATYALGIGARRSDLDYLYEGASSGMKVFPTYAVVPAFPPVVELLGKAGVEMAKVVHGAQKIRAHRPIPPAGTLETRAKLTGIYDLKRFATVILETESTLDGQELFATEWSIIVRDEGGFKGPRPPKDDVPSVPKGRDPDWIVEQATSPEQALLYRISGDTNPLHADPAFAAAVGFADGPILHGLCTFGFVARAAIERAAGGDATRLVAMGAQFRKPVWPGDTIVTHGYDVGDGTVAMAAYAAGRPDPVVTGAWARFS
jgi:acyl dehydratase